MIEDNDWFEEREELDIDFNRLRGKHINVGFREGVSAGEEHILQTSFNRGFMKSATYYEKLAKYRGFLSAVLMFLSMEGKCSQTVTSKIENAMLELEKLEDNASHVDIIFDERDSLINPTHSNGESNLVKNEQPVNISEIDDLAVAMELTYTGESSKPCDSSNCACIDNCCTEESKSTGDTTQNTPFDCVSENSADEISRCCKTENSLPMDAIVTSYSDNSKSSIETPVNRCEVKLTDTIIIMRNMVIDILTEVDSLFDPLVMMKLNSIMHS